MTDSKAQFHLFAEQSPDAVFVSSDARFVYANPAALRLFGAGSAEQLLGQPVIERIHPEHRALVAERIRRLHGHGEPAPLLEETYLRLDGTPVEVEVAAVPFRYEGMDSALVFVRDITERKRVDAALRRERFFLRQVIDASPSLIFVKDRSGRFLLANQALARAYGTTVEGIEGRTDADFNPNAEEVAAFLRDDREVMASRCPKRVVEEPVTFADGQLRWYSTSKMPLFDDDGACNKVLGVANDISQLKHTEDGLHQSRQLVQSMMDNSTAVIFVKDLEGRYLRVNRRYAELFHISDEALRGRTDHDVFPAAVADACRDADRRVLAHGAAQEFEEVIPHDDGLHTYISLKFPLLDPGGQPYAVCGIATDITERKHAEAQITALNLNLERRVIERTQELAAKKEQLREALALNENILMTSAVGIAAYRKDGQCVMANPALAELIGGTLEQVLAQNFRRLGSWQVSGLSDAAERVLSGGNKEELETRLISTFGRKIWVQAHFSRFTSGGEPHLLLMVHNVTEARLAAEELAEREREFRTLAENVPDNIIRYDCEGRVLYLNPTLETTLGCRAAEVIGKHPREFTPDGRYDALIAAVLQVAATGESAEFEQVVPGPEGESRYHVIRIVAEPGPDGRPASVLAVGRDLTVQKKTEYELRLAASVFHNSAEGVLVTDAGGIIVSVNPAFTEITGYSESEALGRKPSLLRSERQGPEFYRALWAALAEDGRWQGEIWNRKKCGEAYLEWLTINRIDDDTGAPMRYVSVFHDITELRRKDERIHHLAFHDALTGLPNRTLMLDRLQHAVKRSQRETQRLAVIFIDLDRFKGVNDGFGHDIGDLLLQEIAGRILSRLRNSDTVARLGGDEFVVLMEDLKEAEHCAILAQELISEIARPMDLRGHSIEIGASLGMALFPEDGTDPLELMKRADMAMYAAKSAGRHTYRFFQQDMLDRTSQRLSREMELRRAIANRDLILHYQPRVELATGRALGVEALVRWRHPIRGLLPPGEFIPLAEESGLILEVGDWVLNEACRQAAEWQTRGRNIRIAVNVSARQLEAGDLVKRIDALALHHQISPSDLEIELTESAVMANPEQAAVLLADLRKLGITVAVDDFGTGYSSLAYLRRLPIDILKIDRSFVRDIDHDEEDAQIVKTILALGHTLKLSVVAEGIETMRQAELLQSLDCTLGQGYLFAKPLPAREIEDWLDALSDIAVEHDA